MSQLVMGMLQEAAKGWGERPIVVAASRRFEIEKALTPFSANITSWGSTLYEYIVGSDLSECPIDLVLLPDVKIALPWLADKLVSQEDWVAAAIISDIISRAVQDKRLAKALKEQWDDLFANAKEFRRGMGVQLENYWREREKWPIKDAAWVYVPQSKFGAADRVFFSAKGITIFTSDFFESLAIEHILKQDTYFVVLKGHRPDLDHRLIGRIINGNGSEQYVYSTHGTARAFVETSPMFAGPELVGADERLTGDLEVVEMSPDRFSELCMRLDGRPYTSLDRFLAWALMFDGKIVGAWSTMFIGDVKMLLLGHIRVAPSAVHKGLEDLIMRVAFSRDARLMYERTYMCLLDSIYHQRDFWSLGRVGLPAVFGEWYAKQR